jgi:anaerobic ribonucleoside-triphosphate reductase
MPPEAIELTCFISAEELDMATKCDAKTEVYSRVCGFFRPVQQWNKGKKEEFKDRQEYLVGSKETDRN